MEFRGIMGGFYRLMEWVMRLSVINVLWVICSFPIFILALTMFISMQTTEGAATVNPLIVAMVILAPFFLYPATAAMFTVARKWVTGDIEVPLFRTFFKGYRENYVQSMLGGLVFVLLFALMFMNFWFYQRMENDLKVVAYIFIPLMVILAGTTIHFFSILVHLHMKFWQLIKNAFLVTLSHPFTSISLIVVNATILYASMGWLKILIPFFMGSFMAIFSFWSFHRIFHRMQTKMAAFEEADKADQENK